MQRLIRFCARHPGWVLLTLLAASVVAATQLPKVAVQVSAEELLVLDDPQRRFYDQVRQTFGDERIVLLVLEDPELLERSKLEALQTAIEALEALPFVERTESLFSVPHVRSVEGFLDDEPYLAKLPDSPEASRQLLTEALKNPFIENVLVASNGQAMAVAVVLLPEKKAPDDQQVTLAIDAIAAQLDDSYAAVYAIGFPHVRTEIASRILEEQGELLPLGVAALLIALFLLLRQAVDILVPVMTAAISILWTFALMGLTGIPLNVVTSTVPILLIVVGSTEDIHLLSEFRHAQSQGFDSGRALHIMAHRMGRTVLLTFITTYVGFLSVGLSGIEVLWQFGLLASSGLAFNFLVTVTLIPAVLALAGRWQLDGRARLFSARAERLAASYWRWLRRKRWGIFAFLGLSALASLFGIPGIQVNHNAVDSLGNDSEVKANVERLNESFAGLESFSIVVNSGIQDTFLKIRYLDELVEIQEFVRDSGFSRSTTSFADYLALVNGALLELDRARMPNSDEEVTELMLFLRHERVSPYVTEDYSRARILVRHNITSTRQLKSFIQELEGFLAEHLDPGLEARITGHSVLTLSATQAMIQGQLISIALLLGFFILIISFLFTDFRVGLLAALPNVFPLLVLFGTMGFTGIPLNVGTAMAAAIAIGIAVDDTMHFMLRYNQELKAIKSQSRAMQKTIYEEALPVLSTSVALIAGFLVFSQSEFTPVAQFGVLSALVIGAALLADFVLTPLVISSLRLVTLWDLLSSHLRQQVIPKSPLFRGMRPWQIRRFVLSSTVLQFKPGEFVFRRNDESNELYLVMRGVVQVTIPTPEEVAESLLVDEFGAGEIFGDVALLADEPRKTNAIALTPTTVLVLTREAIKSTTYFHPFIASRLFLNLSRDVSRRWVDFIARVQAQKDLTVSNDDEDEDQDVNAQRAPGA